MPVCYIGCCRRFCCCGCRVLLAVLLAGVMVVALCFSAMVIPLATLRV